MTASIAYFLYFSYNHQYMKHSNISFTHVKLSDLNNCNIPKGMHATNKEALLHNTYSFLPNRDI